MLLEKVFQRLLKVIFLNNPIKAGTVVIFFNDNEILNLHAIVTYDGLLYFFKFMV